MESERALKSVQNAHLPVGASDGDGKDLVS